MTAGTFALATLDHSDYRTDDFPQLPHRAPQKLPSGSQ